MKKILFFGLMLLAVNAASAQSARLLADKIVAIVGDKIVLRSDLVNYIEDMKRGGNDVPENPIVLFWSA